MCTQISTAEFIPAMINCIAESKNTDAFTLPNTVLKYSIKELQKKCWTNVNFSYPAINDLIPILNFAFDELDKDDFISVDEERNIHIQRANKSCCITMADFFFSPQAKWYSILKSICEKCLTVENGIVTLKETTSSQNNNYDTVPKDYVEYLDLAYS